MINPKNECYTPASFVDPIRQFAGHFDFDPFSCSEANKVIKANWFCSLQEDRDAYLDDWIWLWYQAKTIWCNPEYDTKGLTKAIDKLFEHLEGKEIYLLVNSDTATANYQRCLSNCQAVLFPSKRIPFYRPYSLPYSCPEMYAPYAYKPNQNDRAQTLFFFGTIKRAFEFKQELSHLGKVFIND